MKIVGGHSGTKFFLNFYPDGNFEAGKLEGSNTGKVGSTGIGKNWTRDGNKVCRNYYRFYNGPQCGTFALKDGVLGLVDMDGSSSPITELVFVAK